MYKTKGMKSFLGIFIIFMLIFSTALPIQAIVKNDDGQTTISGDREYAFIQFGGEPIASYDGSINGYERTKPTKGKKVDLQSPSAKKYGNHLEVQRNNYIKWLAKHFPQVEVVTEYDVTFNGVGIKLNGANLKEVSRGPGAVKGGYSATYQKAMSESTSLIEADAIWESLGGQATAGEGMKVGIIDSGIDQDHPFLKPNEGMVYPKEFPKGDRELTTSKVIVAKVFSQNPKLSAEAVDSHGTHVAGTVAGKAGTTTQLLEGQTMSGVAPGAYLGNYNVFPGDIANAKSIFIAKAVEEAVEDGMDVLNLSLGGTPHKGADLLDMTVNSAVDAGVVVAISAGNEGPGNYTVGSPGTAEKVITVAATTNSRTFAMTLESAALSEPAIATTGTQGGEVKEPITGEYALWEEVAGGDQLACTAISGKPLEGKIAVIQRGSCTFLDKINHASEAGAAGVIIYQLDGIIEPTPMSSDGALVPAVMIGYDAGIQLVNWKGDRTVTISNELQKVETEANLLANFSSWGPTPNYTLKPDVAAPGVNIYSSVVGGEYELYQGTSMASPHVAGAAAVLLSHSRKMELGWGPAEVKAALMGTAQDITRSVLPDTDVSDPLKVGAGLINLSKAMNPPALAYPSSLSFGLVRPVGNQTYMMKLTLQNPTDKDLAYTIHDNENIQVSDMEVTIPAKGSKEVTFTVINRGNKTAGQEGTPLFVSDYIRISSNEGDIRIPYLYVMDYNR